MLMNLLSGEGQQVSRAPLQPLDWTPILLGPQHLDSCLALDGASLGGLWSEAQWRQELEAPERPCVGMMRGATVLALACGWLVLDELHITALAVGPSWRRRGLGLLILQALLHQGHASGARRATLEVATTNTAACSLYRAAGFEEAGIRRGYYRNGDDALIQWKKLTDQEFG